MGPADVDIALVRKAIADEEILAEFCTAVLRRHPPARTKLTLMVAHQRQHISRLRATLTDLDPPVTRAPTRVPARVDAALMAAGRLSARTGDARLVACQVATAGLLAELLGSVAASHAQAASILAPQGEGVVLTTPTTSALTAAQPLQSCLAAEHAAVYGYGLLGGVLSAAVSGTALAKAATSSYDVHRARRDRLTQLLRVAGERPVAAAPAYQVPVQVSGPDTASRLARILESRCAVVYARATAQLLPGARRLVSTALVDCATRGVSWGAEASAFPGLAVS